MSGYLFNDLRGVALFSDEKMTLGPFLVVVLVVGLCVGARALGETVNW